MGPTRRSPPGWPHGAGPIARRLPHGGVKLWGCVRGGFWRIGGLPHRGPILWGEAAPWGRPHTGGHAQRGGPAHRKPRPTCTIAAPTPQATPIRRTRPHRPRPLVQTTPISRVPAPHRKPRLQTGPRPQKRPRPSPSTSSASHDVSATLIGSPRSDEVGGRVRPSCRTLIG